MDEAPSPEQPRPPDRADEAEGDPREWDGAQVIHNADRLLLGHLDEEFADNPDPEEPDWDRPVDGVREPDDRDGPTEEELAGMVPREAPVSTRGPRSIQQLLEQWRADAAAPCRDAPPPPRLELWCDRPQPDFPGLRIPRRKRAELVLAAALMAAALPARDVRPRPPERGEASTSHDTADEQALRSASDEEPDEPPDFSAEGIRRALLARWEYRPAGIRYARWEEMLASFAERMAARLQDEDQQSSLEPAVQPTGGAGEPAADAGAGPDDAVDPVQMVREPSAQSSDGAGSDSEKAESRPADLTLGRRGPETRTDDHAASHPQRKRHKQSEHEASSPQANLGNSPPLAG